MKTPVKAYVAADEAEFWMKQNDDDADTRGMVCFHRENYILCECPCGCKGLMNLPTYPEGTPKPEGRTAWSISANKEFPSLDPSIRDLSGCRFHGFLKAGLWTFCSDSGVKE